MMAIIAHFPPCVLMLMPLTHPSRALNATASALGMPLKAPDPSCSQHKAPLVA
jgi:hypothetical protein